MSSDERSVSAEGLREVISLIIPGNPVPWAAHQGYGNRAYNPRAKDRARIEREIRAQYFRTPLSCAVAVTYHFFMPIPTTESKKNKSLMASNAIKHCKRPDVTNLIKFLEDCLKGLVIVDDNQVCEIMARKSYSELPRSLIQISLL